jgi:hypothetical protein
MSRYLRDILFVASRKGMYRALFCCCIIAGITFIAFSPSLKNGFTNWDDSAYVVYNPDIKAFGLRHVAKIFSSKYLTCYQPLTMLTYMAEYRFFRLNPMAYHCDDVLLHIINCLLVFALMYALSGKYFTSLLVALLFAVHPLRVESVAWIAERKGVLSSFFYFLSLLFYLRYMKKGKKKFYGFSLLSLLLSLLSKGMAVSQPLVLLLIDYLNNRKLDKKVLLEKVPFFGVAGIFVVVTFLTMKSAVPVSDCLTLSVIQRICVPFYAMVFYLVKTIVPFHLCSYYSVPTVLDAGMNLKLLVSPFLVIGSAVAVYHFFVKYFRGSPRLSSEHRGSVMGTPESEAIFGDPRKLAFGLLFFLITALPLLQIVPVGRVIVSERYTYVPMIGICFLFVETGRYLLREKFGNNSTVKKLCVAGMSAVIVAFACMTHERCAVWNSSVSLWSDVIAKFPGALAYYNRGDAYYAKGNYDQAIHDNTQAIMLNLKYAKAYNNRGSAYYAKGDNDRAIEDYNQAIMLDPGYAEPHYNRGLAYHAKGDDGHCKDDVKKACDLGLAIACKLLRAIERPASHPKL